MGIFKSISSYLCFLMSANLFATPPKSDGGWDKNWGVVFGEPVDDDGIDGEVVSCSERPPSDSVAALPEAPTADSLPLGILPPLRRTRAFYIPRSTTPARTAPNGGQGVAAANPLLVSAGPACSVSSSVPLFLPEHASLFLPTLCGTRASHVSEDTSVKPKAKPKKKTTRCQAFRPHTTFSWDDKYKDKDPDSDSDQANPWLGSF